MKNIIRIIKSDHIAKYSFLVSISVILMSFFGLFVANYILFVFTTMIELLIILLFIVFLFFSFLGIFKGNSKTRIIRLSSFIFLISSLIVWYVNANIDTSSKLYYWHKSPQFKSVAESIVTGKIKPIEKKNSPLLNIDTKIYRNVASNVLIENKGNDMKIFFFVNSGLGYFSGYVYSSKDIVLKNGDFGMDYAYSKKIEPHWYLGYLD